jgi:hypothetical protein
MEFNAIVIDTLSLNQKAFEQVRSQQTAQLHSRKDGNWFAALIANNPRIVRSFSDHEEVVEKLVEARQFDTLSYVASSGYLDATQATHYRAAYKQASAC